MTQDGMNSCKEHPNRREGVRITPQSKHYDQNFLRVVLHELDKLHLPVIVRATYLHRPNEKAFVTFLNVRAYAPGNRAEPRPLCDHINLMQDDIAAIYGESWQDAADGEEFFLVTYPYCYFTDHIPRYGLRLANVFDFYPIQRDAKYIDPLPHDQYVDFRHFADGLYLKPKCTKPKKKKKPKKRPRPQPVLKKNQSKAQKKKKNTQRRQKIQQVIRLLQELDLPEDTDE